MGKESIIGPLYAKIQLAWWIFPYLRVVTAISLWISQEPNWDRVGYWVREATRVRIEG